MNEKNLTEFFEFLNNSINNGNIKTFNLKDLTYWIKEIRGF